MKKLILISSLFICYPLFSQELCDTTDMYTFDYNGKSYAIVKDKKVWNHALFCAHELGGTLAIINNQEEQDAIWAEIPNAEIENNNTIANDGGQVPYLWLGGNDMNIEGEWLWVNEDNQTTQFWEGSKDGSAIGGLYNNWGSNEWGGEPDNSLDDQDALGLALTDWPFGNAGQWNDLNENNPLYFIVEITADTTENEDTVSIWGYTQVINVSIYPNPAFDFFIVDNDDIKKISIINNLGQVLLNSNIEPSKKVNIRTLSEGFYFVILEDSSNRKYMEKILVH